MYSLRLSPLPFGATREKLECFLLENTELQAQDLGPIRLKGDQAILQLAGGKPNEVLLLLEGTSFLGSPLQVRLEKSASPEEPLTHFDRMAQWLDWEAAAELEAVLERRAEFSSAEAEQSGEVLCRMLIAEEESGLGGRLLVSLHKGANDPPLPWNRLSPGTPVLLTEENRNAPESFRGIVSRQERARIQVALDQGELDSDAESFRLDRCDDRVSLERQKKALLFAKKAKNSRLADLRAVLLGSREPVFSPPAKLAELQLRLNPSQTEAVSFALSAEDIALIHGPPGTGKTTTVVELMLQAVKEGARILCTAPSNLAVDNLVEKLLARGHKPVRLGHPARVLPELRERTLDALVEGHENVRLARQLARQARELFRKSGRWSRGRPEPGQRNAQRQEARALLADARRLESQAVSSILQGASILCGTTTGLDESWLKGQSFDLVIVDEACQSTEPGCWIPLRWGKKLVLAGDPFQLPPTVISQEARQEGFGISLMERLYFLYGDAASRMLQVQYRMHQTLMSFSSSEFYRNQLKADDSVAQHLLSGMEGVSSAPITEAPLLFMDTAGGGWEEEQEPRGKSRLNRKEASWLQRCLQTFVELGVPPREIGIIAPYSAQVRLLREQILLEDVEIGSVDAFQGREKELILFCLVRSNQDGELGFLRDIRRINVGITRARRKLVIVGDSATLGSDPFYRRMFDWVESATAYQTIWDDPANLEL